MYHNQGVCYLYLQERDKAKACLEKAIEFQKHEISYVMLGKCYISEGDNRKAIEVYKQAAEWVLISNFVYPKKQKLMAVLFDVRQ